jgi:hypothetical protein
MTSSLRSGESLAQNDGSGGALGRGALFALAGFLEPRALLEPLELLRLLLARLNGLIRGMAPEGVGYVGRMAQKES